MKVEDTVMAKNEMLACSLVSRYPFKDVRDVIEEASLHQAEITWDMAIEEVVRALKMIDKESPDVKDFELRVLSLIAEYESQMKERK